MMKTFMKAPKGVSESFFLRNLMSGTMIFVSSAKGLTLTHVDVMCFLRILGHVLGRCVLWRGLLQDAQSIAGSIIPAVVRG